MFQPTTFIYLPHLISFTVMVDHIKPRNLRQEEKTKDLIVLCLDIITS